MAAIRILVVDDSLVIRKVLSDTLSKDPELEVVATAGDGRIALAKISQMHPDVVTLDVEMPVMNGLETLAELRRLYPNCRSSCAARSPNVARQRLWMRSPKARRTMPPSPTIPGSPAVAMEAVRVEPFIPM